MGLYAQPNEWSCGPFALKHALVAIGQLTSEASISRIAHPHWWWGTDEVKLAKAANAFDCELPFVRKRSAEEAYNALTMHLSQRLPVILCVDDWGHWITVVRHESDRFVVIDSKRAPVLRVLPWAALKKRWRYYVADSNGTHLPVFDLHPVTPRFEVNAKAQFSVERAQFLRRQENADLAQHWDSYLEDLLEICRPRTATGRPARNARSFSSFLREHQAMLAGRLAYWHGELAHDAVFRLLQNFRFVAETYSMQIPTAGQDQVLTDLSMLLGMWASAEFGIGPMYGSSRSSE